MEDREEGGGGNADREEEGGGGDAGEFSGSGSGRGRAKGAVLLGVFGGWFFELHPPCSRQCFLQNWRPQSGAMRDCPQPRMGQLAGFPCVAAAPRPAGMKAVVVVGLPSKVEGLAECGEVLGDFEEPFSHRKVLQSSPLELGPRHCLKKGSEG